MNPYKISTFTLAVALVAVVVYSCDQTGSTAKTETTADAGDNDSIHLKQYVDSLRRSKPTRDTGDPIDYATAWTHLNLYKAEHQIDCKADSWDVDQIYGHTFGINKFRAFLETVIDLDTKHPDSLLGIRVYRSMVVEKNPYNGQMQSRGDVFLIPVGKSGKSIFPVDDCERKEGILFDDGLILNTSMPCPNRCQ